MLLAVLALALGMVWLVAEISRPTKKFTDDSAAIKQFTNARHAILKNMK